MPAEPTDATVTPSALLALLAAGCFGGALVVGRFGLRHASPLMGATISVTVTLFALLSLSPALLHSLPSRFGGAFTFAAVGIFYPAAVMVLSYASNRVLGPTLTGAAASTTPLFATAAAAIVLRESVAAHVYVGGIVTVAGLVLLTLRAPMRKAPGWRLGLPLSGATLRGVAQMLVKFGLTLWPSPFGAALLSYGTSAAMMWGVSLTRGSRRGRLTRVAVCWFAVVGLLNGSAVLLMYHALQRGHVAEVSTLVATYPLFTMVLSGVFLRTEALSVHTALAVAVVIAGVSLVIHA